MTTHTKYTDEEKRVVREMHPTHTAGQIANRLWGRPDWTKRVYNLASALGLRKWPRWPRNVVKWVGAFVKQGLPDRVIAETMCEVFKPGRLGRDQVKNIRRRLGLPSNPDTDAKRRAIEKQRRTLGVSSGGQLRSLSYRRYAAENGWPEDLRPREVQILNVLADAGVPMTRLELAQRIGARTDRMGCNGTLALLSGNGPGGTYTASLLRRGLLSVLKRASTVRGCGKGRSRDLYLLGPTALAILERKAACHSATAN